MATDVRLTGMPGSDVEALVRMHNAMLVDISALKAQSDTNNSALLTMQTAIASARYRAYGDPGFVISTNFDVKNANAISYTNGGTLKTLSANTSFATGTAAIIATVKWGAAMLSVNASGTAVVTWYTSAGAGYATEAAAIAALAAVDATDTPLGYITVLAAGSTWTAGTDALQGGTGGTPATTTNYYNSIDPNGTVLGDVTSGSASFDTVSSTPILLSADTLTVGGATYTG
jgi:hypothetical protein